jgi:cleavage and polyadenylation specificity factor subunit 3
VYRWCARTRHPIGAQVLEHEGIKFWCYNAGHVLGAAMFMLEIAGVHILYTGDYSMEVRK